jgi:hypothetical protein
VILDVFQPEHERRTPMTLTESDLSALLDALKAGEFDERIRTSLQWILQQLIEAEATALIGAAPYERSEDRVAQRTGPACSPHRRVTSSSRSPSSAKAASSPPSSSAGGASTGPSMRW